MKKRRIPVSLVLVGTVLLGGLGGCEKSGPYVDPNGPNVIVTQDAINIQDWSNAGESMINSLLTSGVLEQTPRKPAVFAISLMRNNTSERVDTEMLTKKISVALTRTGKAVRTVSLSNEDSIGKDTTAIDNFANDRKPTAADRPDFTLSGKILEDKVRAGNTRQTTYIFQLSLVNRNGHAVWEEERQITKQGSKPSMGF